MMSLLIWLGILVTTLVFSLLFFTDRTKKIKIRISDLRTLIGTLLFDLLIISHFLFWVIPYHGFLIIISLFTTQLGIKGQREN